MGADVDRGDAGLTVGGGAAVCRLDVDLHDVGEAHHRIAALAAFADGPRPLRGIGHLRGHETDRLAALAADWPRWAARSWRPRTR